MQQHKSDHRHQCSKAKQQRIAAWQLLYSDVPHWRCLAVDRPSALTLFVVWWWPPLRCTPRFTLHYRGSLIHCPTHHLFRPTVSTLSSSFLAASPCTPSHSTSMFEDSDGYGHGPGVGPGAILDKERRHASFSVTAMTNMIYGGPEVCALPLCLQPPLSAHGGHTVLEFLTYQPLLDVCVSAVVRK